MDLPATYYGKLDKRNPVVSVFERDVKTVLTLMRRVTSGSSQDHSSCVKGIKTLVEIWKKYKHRLPSKMYEERMLDVADFLCEMELYQVALWQGYGLHLLQFSPMTITNIADVDHFMACFFPDGLDIDQDTFTLKIRAMQGCALCMFEQEKRERRFSQKQLCNLLKVLNFLRILMQALQQNEHLCWLVYNVSLYIYKICHYLMTMNCSAQALEYLLWASVSLELSVPIMTPEHLPWIATLYCAVCHCYYDSQGALQAEEFARRALGKIDNLARWERENGVPVSRQTQNAFREASIKLAAMVFKRLVFENQKNSRPVLKPKPKSSVKELPNVPWPRTATERVLTSLFDSGAAYFLGILEALWDTRGCPLQNRTVEESDQQEVIMELLSAGMTILSGAGSEPLGAVTATSTLIDLAIAGENKVSVSSALSFIKLLFHYNQSEKFSRLAKEMLQALEGQSFRKAESELTLLDSINSLLHSQRSHSREDSTGRHTSLFPVSEELTGVVKALHSCVCLRSPEIRPDGDMVLNVVLFLWNKVKVGIQGDELQYPTFTYHIEKIDNLEKWLWCLSELCEVVSVCDLANMDCMIAAEMTYMLAVLLERAAESRHQIPSLQVDHDNIDPNTFSLAEKSRTELLQKVCEVVDWGLKALEKDEATPLPQDGSAITDSVLMQKDNTLLSSNSSPCVLRPPGEQVDLSDKQQEVESKAAPDIKNSQHTESTFVSVLAKELYLELLIIQHRASLKLLPLNAVTESELLGRIKKNKVSKAVFLTQKALLVHMDKGTNDSSSQTKSLLEEASALIDKASVEERKLYLSNTVQGLNENRDNEMKENKDDPPPAPILLSRTDTSLTFAPAPYNLEGQLCWYQLHGRAAEGVDLKVRVGDCSLKGTGSLVPALPECLLKVEGLEPNQKYAFALAAYNSQGKMLGNAVGATTTPVLASTPLPLLSTWAHLAQVAYQAEQFALAKRACRTLWSHFTYPDNGFQTNKDKLSTTTGLHTRVLQRSSLHLGRLFLTSIFIETEINIQQGSLFCQSFGDIGPFIWEQEARLEECDRMLVAMDLAMWLNDGIFLLQAVVICYGLLTPLIFHQVKHSPVVEVLKKCLIVLEVISNLPKQNWTGRTSESFVHMIACITYYLAKTLRALKEPHVASAMLDSGRKLLKKVSEARLQRIFQRAECITAVKGEKVLPLLRALHCKNGKNITFEAANNEITGPVTGDLTSLYDQIFNATLTAAYQHVMKLKSKPYFLELAAQLLQRAMKEGPPDLVLKWGESMFQSLPSHEFVIGLYPKSTVQESQRAKQVHQNSNEPAQNKIPANKDDKKKKIKQKISSSMLQKVKTNRGMQTVEKLLARMTSVNERHKKQIQHRKVCCDERVWKSQLNYTMAKACLDLLYQSLGQSHGGSPEHRYSQLDPVCFSLPFSGVLLRKNTKQELPSKYVEKNSSSLSKHTRKEKTNVHPVDDSASEDSGKEEERVERQLDMHEHSAELFNRAAIHLRRAMVLAHRGSHWTLLRCVCETVWDQSCRINVLAAQCDHPFPPDQLHNTLTPLLVLSADLIMDMMHRLGLWSVYDGDFAEEELQSALRFSATLDDSTQVDLRWVCALVLHTLERLHDSRKWESLAHFGLVFNSYTRERYALIVAPLIINAQRRLLERINSFGGPSVPQPHHVKTQMTSGKEVTYSNYAGCQLLSGWTPLSAPQTDGIKTTETKNTAPPGTAVLKGAEKQKSMCLVRVPLNVEDTLSRYRQAFERRPQCLLVFHQSQALLLRLLANTQPCFAAQLQHSDGRRQVKFTAPNDSPNAQSCDLDEDFSNPSAVYKLPVSPDYMSTITDAYSASIKYLEDSGKNYFRGVALHEMGNLQFYNENPRAAQSYWSKAVDCALQSSGTFDKWDGISIGGCSMEKMLKQAGVWGCLHAAGLTAKIAQYTLTSDITQRTKYCLLSAHLFKCVLCCSMAQPQADRQYAHHSIGEELLPGTDLFSEPHRVHLGTTVTSLKFLCHWLYTKGFYMRLLPMLALYLHLVGTVCRDVERTVEGKILKIRTLTELCLFAEAVKESFELIQGAGIFLPYGQYVAKSSPPPMKTFYNSKCLQDNAEALEELVNSDFAPDICTLYGSTLCLRCNLARTQLILALCNTVHGAARPVADSLEGEASAATPGCSELSQETEGSCVKTEEPKFLNLAGKEKLTAAQLKFALLEGASSLLCAASEQLSSQSGGEAENLELIIESKLLRANLYLQQEQFGLSSEMAISSLVLLQTSPVITSRSRNDAGIRAEQRGDSCRAIEASERIGVHLWLRGRLALFQSLAAKVSDGVPHLQGKIEEALQVLQEGLDECAQWGEPDIQGLLMLEGAKLVAQRGKTDNSMAMLKETINLLSGGTSMPPASTLTVARALLLLSDLREGHNATLLNLLHGLLKNELLTFGESVVLENGQLSLFPPTPSNIYLPYLKLLNQDTLQM